MVVVIDSGVPPTGARRQSRADRAARLCGARDAAELRRALIAFDLARFEKQRPERRNCALKHRTLSLACFADHRVNGYRCPVHLVGCQCVTTDPDAVGLTDAEALVVEDLLPVLKGFLKEARREANRLTGGRAERTHRRRLEKGRRRFRPPWLARAKSSARCRAREFSRGSQRTARHCSGESPPSGGDPPDGGDPDPARLLLRSCGLAVLLVVLLVVALRAMSVGIDGPKATVAAEPSMAACDQGRSEPYWQFLSVDCGSEEHTKVLAEFSGGLANGWREEARTREAALASLGYDSEEIYQEVEQATGWFDDDSVEICADPYDYCEAYEDAVWSAVQARLTKAGFDLQIPAVWDSAWEACREAMESPGDPRETRPWVGTLHDEARRQEACARRAISAFGKVRALKIRPARARRSRGRAIRRRGSRRVASTSAGGGSSGEPPGEPDSDEPAYGRLSISAVGL